MDNPVVLSIEAVNALVPRLQELMQAQMRRREEIERGLSRLATDLGHLPESVTESDDDSPTVRDQKRAIATRIERYQAAWGELEAMGAVLKDARSGLVDFCGRVDGKLVWLCWRFGENAVSHYHGLDEGFSARKPLEATLRHRHLN